MLLKQLIQQPTTSSKLLVCDPFRMPDPAELVKEVVGLANADVDGPRYILFGINAGAMEGSRIVGIDESTAADLKKAHRLISTQVEPVISLAFVYDRIDNKLVGALEIDGSDEGPFIVGKDFSEELASGQTWIREGRELRSVDVADLASADPHDSTEVIDEADLVELTEIPSIDVGFNDESDCKYIELDIPDTSDPPFANEKDDVKKRKDLKETFRDKVNTVTTQILRLARGRSQDSDPESSTDVVKAAQDVCSDADNHYYYEEKALQVNFTVCNNGAQSVRDLHVKLGFPRVTDFDIADRIYVSPFDKRSAVEIKNLGYPTVEHTDKGTFVRERIEVLDPAAPKRVFKSSVRMAVGPRMENRKLAILYSLHTKDKQRIGEGRLKIKFGKVSA